MLWILIVGYTVLIAEVLVGLGFVIFVHELGHFLVAKLCGVKCEKFYLGFDIGGLKLCKFRYGETEYGIGILPLGGYVKMLGQEDNPARIREEMERAKREGGSEGEGRRTEVRARHRRSGDSVPPLPQWPRCNRDARLSLRRLSAVRSASFSPRACRSAWPSFRRA